MINYRNNLSMDITSLAELGLEYDKGDVLSDDFETLENLLPNYQALRNNGSQLDQEISDLQQIRNDLISKFNELRLHKHIDETKCPFCNISFQSFEELKKAYDKHENYLIEISSANSQKLQNIQSNINKVATRILKKISEELNGIKVDIDENLFNKIRNLHTMYSKDEGKIKRFKSFINAYLELAPCRLGKLSYEELQKTSELKQKEFRSKLLAEDAVYHLFDKYDIKIIKNKYEELVTEYSDSMFIPFQVEPKLEGKITMDILDSKLEKLMEKLKEEINKEFFIDESLLSDPNRILKEYFDNNIELLENINIIKLEQKRQYLEKQCSLVKNQKFEDLSRKIGILSKSREQLEKINKIYEEEVKAFKISIIKQLRIPFFIYSAKMLQNYQQGMGIFLTYKEATENTEESAVIKFKSDPSNDHDAMYQLSTGQLAVVSLAFTLSLNTMFKLSEHLNFLMIDDPIQDMDSMNVLSFIEILRHGILDQYQIILSTYSDYNALFMGYKFANSSSQVDIKYKNVRELGLNGVSRKYKEITGIETLNRTLE